MSILNVNKWGEIKCSANFPGSKNFPGAASAQIASSNQYGLGGPEGGGGLVSDVHGGEMHNDWKFETLNFKVG